ncbi:MAG: phosphonate C-P lyase system protein PhnH [Thermodesulfobacteriota bacterium]|nr:phosphonate C-P lyase system protein PhnH [Thermodesulfobacteriota bacterium]
MTIDVDIERLNRNNFRNCLEALARPGCFFQVTPFFDSGLMALAVMLLYSEVCFYQQAVGDWNMIRALTGSTLSRAETADYLFIDAPSKEALMAARPGEQHNPEFSATCICRCTDLATGTPVTLSGPGIDGVKRTVLPASPDFIHLLAQKNLHFPLGVDLFFISDNNRILGLPRSTRVELL